MNLDRTGLWSLEAWPLGWVLCSTRDPGLPVLREDESA